MPQAELPHSQGAPAAHTAALARQAPSQPTSDSTRRRQGKGQVQQQPASDTAALQLAARMSRAIDATTRSCNAAVTSASCCASEADAMPRSARLAASVRVKSGAPRSSASRPRRALRAGTPGRDASAGARRPPRWRNGARSACSGKPRTHPHGVAASRCAHAHGLCSAAWSAASAAGCARGQERTRTGVGETCHHAHVRALPAPRTSSLATWSRGWSRAPARAAAVRYAQMCWRRRRWRGPPARGAAGQQPRPPPPLSQRSAYLQRWRRRARGGCARGRWAR